MMVAAPASIARATTATPTSRPATIYKVPWNPIVMLRDSAKVMHEPGAADTKNVGMNRPNKLNLLNLVPRADNLVNGCHDKDMTCR